VEKMEKFIRPSDSMTPKKEGLVIRDIFSSGINKNIVKRY